MNAIKTMWLAVTIVIFIASCGDFPGADGRYAHGSHYYTAGGSRWAP